MSDNKSEQQGLFGDGELPRQPQPASTAETSAETAIRRVPISAIRLWPGNPRSRQPFDTDRDRDLADSIARHGQSVPCIVRPTDDGTYELIVGCRRYGSVAHLAIANPVLQLLVEVRAMTDEEAFLLVESENAARKDATPYERASYHQWALTTLFEGNQSALARSLKVSVTTISRSLDLVRLPQQVNDLIADPNALTPNMVAAITPKLNDEDTRAKVIEIAEALGAEGKTYPAGKAISLILARLKPQRKIEPLVVKDARAGQTASISANAEGSMIVRITLQDISKRSMSKFMKDVSEAMPGFAAKIVGDA